MWPASLGSVDSLVIDSLILTFVRPRLFLCYDVGGRAMVITNVKASVQSGKLILKIKRESGNLSTIGCHFPLKSTNFGTLLDDICNNSPVARQFCMTFLVLNWSFETRRSSMDYNGLSMDYSFCILMNANIKFSLLKYLKTAFLKPSLIGCDVKLRIQRIGHVTITDQYANPSAV